ncbi:hypothetical protein AOXY_G10 [Acipenser oxyrinchus oxyrinchus]|uniref:Uncharacterized protein n=1 Tax=Acipenser oxyrinchus oxyrinchus TaxID=40147 RepID=A0AAD8GJK1_ACIOX|nr:hypothetical protein AOXY_G10 [Acipenser oxyrinchus oxyrinchus]
MSLARERIRKHCCSSKVWQCCGLIYYSTDQTWLYSLRTPEHSAPNAFLPTAGPICRHAGRDKPGSLLDAMQ